MIEINIAQALNQELSVNDCALINTELIFKNCVKPTFFKDERHLNLHADRANKI